MYTTGILPIEERRAYLVLAGPLPMACRMTAEKAAFTPPKSCMTKRQQYNLQA